MDDDGRALARRLTVAYCAAFGLVLLAFAVAVHVAYALELGHDERARLDELLRAGRTAYEVVEGRTRVDLVAPQLLDAHVESVAWFDERGRLVAREGAARPPKAPPAGSETRTAVLWTRSAATPHGSVWVALRLDRDARSLARGDLGLGFGLLVALALAAIGGRYLATRAIDRTVASLRALRDFTADAAHELRGPLAALLGNADASLRDPVALGPAHERRLVTIATTARELARTVEDLLLIARAETPLDRELFAIDLDGRVADAVEARRALASQRGVALSTQIGGRARVYGNPSELDRILGNLIDNALRFTPEGGAVTVACVAERGGFCVRVSDTGIGIAPDDLPRIFERFWRRDPVRGQDTGSGLGLAIVRALVRRHGGDIVARSTLASGSEFTVWLPPRPPRSGLGTLGAKS